jgi:hypothetical protein
MYALALVCRVQFVICVPGIVSVSWLPDLFFSAAGCQNFGHCIVKCVTFIFGLIVLNLALITFDFCQVDSDHYLNSSDYSSLASVASVLLES